MTQLFAIERDNTWLHVYADPQSLIAANDEVTKSPSTFDFYNVAGRRLVPVLNGSSTLAGLQESGDPPDVPAVSGRLCAVVRHLESTIGERIGRGNYPVGTREQALLRLPELDGRSLADSFTLLTPDFGHAAPIGGGHNGGGTGIEHDGSWWHNFWCHW